ncbi:hypothetical protein EG328_005411 [Venturia inaequalis]|uniref:Holocytochrome c-type synthase n=1 Tax=Venturia inaequalis TaxID=5025 RepID=A0A8H3VD52_VENIN|nr:hypothetical protein EG328_005411 [Venturia inaequalis]KAE9992429.1 hypothetical protein EG327_009071 [Venturia inaequalis]
MGQSISREDSTPPPPSIPPHKIGPKAEASDAEACPVDHKTREAWLAQARQKAASAQPPPPTSTSPTPAPSIPPGESCDSTSISQSAPPPSAILSKLGLDQRREISTIPRAAASTDVEAETKKPANNEIESGKDKSGKWIYPSEQMFFEAMRRKNYDPKAEDMRSIVPIHNAVNERAWSEILEWEKGQGSESCGGPKLLSFMGTSKALTPRARFNTLLGYTAPFDRHDWVIDRCGKRVDYVIDFYSGRDENKPGKSLNFYLDVRPKLNSWEGVVLRARKAVGL